MSDVLACDEMRGIPGIRSDPTCLMEGERSDTHVDTVYRTREISG